MSSFLVSNKSINAILNSLIFDNNVRNHLEYVFRNNGIDLNEDTAHDFGQQLINLNAAAVNARYREKDQAPEFFFTRSLRYTNPIQLYKHLRCFLYQCSEGDIDQTPLYKTMTDISNAVASVIVQGLPGYETAEWE